MNTKDIDLKKLTVEILDSCYLMSLGTFDEAGPWVSDLVYVYDSELSIYWLSTLETRHSKAIRLNGKAAATMTASNDQGEDNVGIQLSGKAEEIAGDLPEIAKIHLLKRKKDPQNHADILGTNKKWYKLTPDLIEIIYEPLWGYTKQKLEL
jgi:uncharacterized protein YhbP (UPF0306 family)